MITLLNISNHNTPKTLSTKDEQKQFSAIGPKAFDDEEKEDEKEEEKMKQE